MEQITGKSLTDIIPKEGLPVKQVLRYAIPMADALSAAHAAGILHRDLKPGNVMVTSAGLVKLLDFGLAKIMHPPVSELDATNTFQAAPMTTAGTIMGTASYMSPEQASGRNLDGRSDIFAFGLVLYEMVTRRRAFEGETPITTITSVLRGDEPRTIAELVKDVPPQLERLISRCLRKEADRRWQTMKDLHMALVELKEDLDTGTIASGQHAIVAPKRKPVSVGMAVAGGVAVIALAAAGWYVTHPVKYRVSCSQRHSDWSYGGRETRATQCRSVNHQARARGHCRPRDCTASCCTSPGENKPAGWGALAAHAL